MKIEVPYKTAISPQPTEKRTVPRASLRETVVFRAMSGINAGGLLLNLGENGAYFVSQQTLLVRSSVTINIALPFGTKKKLCMVSGTIVRVDKDQSGRFHAYGVFFDPKTPSEVRETLRSYVSRRIGTYEPPASSGAKIAAIVKPAAQRSEKTDPSSFVPSDRLHERAGRGKAHHPGNIRWNEASRPVPRKPGKKPKSKGSVFSKLAGMIPGLNHSGLAAELSSIVPLKILKLQNGILHASVDANWIFSTTTDVKQEKITKLFEKVLAREIHRIELVDGKGHKLARIGFKSSDRRKIDIAIYQ